MVPRHLFPILALSLALQSPAFAQENPSFVRRVVDRILAPSLELDPEAVYQPEARWHFALTGDLRQAAVSQTHDFNMFSATLNDHGELELGIDPAHLSTVMQGNLVKGVGFQAGLGGLSLSLSKKFREKGSGNQTVSFDYMSAGYAFQLQYFKLSEPVQYSFTVGEPGDLGYGDVNGTTDEPGRMRALTLDAFYAFNRRTFAYSAAYKGSVIQRRSAGSWMFGSKLTLGEFKVDPMETITSLLGGQSRQTSAQVSFGGGYSYNFVPVHRQPYGEKEKGLRNFTVNLTFIPMVTMFNQFTSTLYEQSESGDYVPGRKDVMNGRLLVNYVARIGLGYVRDLYTFNLSANYDSYSYDGTSTITLANVEYDQVKTSGGFRRWVVGLRVCRRF